MPRTEGLWPGVVAFANDASMCCIDCAEKRYGEKAVQAVIHSRPGYEKYKDHEGNPLNPILATQEDDLDEQYCDDCHEPLFDEEAKEWKESIKDPEFKHLMTFPSEEKVKEAWNKIFDFSYVKDVDWDEPYEEEPNWTLTIKTVYKLTTEQINEILEFQHITAQMNLPIKEDNEEE